MSGGGSERPRRVAGYRTYLREYERLRREYVDEMTAGNEERAALVAYEAICVHSKMRNIERMIEEVCEGRGCAGEPGGGVDHELRVFLVLRYLRGLSMEEAAEQMEVSRSTVYRMAAQAEELFAQRA